MTKEKKQKADENFILKNAWRVPYQKSQTVYREEDNFRTRQRDIL
jgi:hypothetical protein